MKSKSLSKNPKRGRAKIKKGKARFSKQNENNRILTGTLKLHREGEYGFFLPDDPDQVDVFIPARRMGDALDGDRIQASIWRSGAQNRWEGSVEQVLERIRRYFVGQLKKDSKIFLVECVEPQRSLSFQVDEVDLKGARLGESIGIEALSFPKGKTPGQAKVIQLFGSRGDEPTEIDIIILKHQLQQKFPEEVQKAAQQIAQEAKIELTPERKDLRNLGLVTIDGETARDFDDAICVQKEKAGFRLWVAIADVSHYVTPGSVLDQEALARGTSVYFPDKVLPMLPEALSNDLCSLRPHEDRYAFTAEMVFDKKAHLKASKFYPSLIQSKARLTYTQVSEALLKKEAKSQAKVGQAFPMLQEALELFKLLRKKRIKRGSIDFDLPEPEIIRDLEDGNISNIVKSERNEAHMLIEEFMIAANEAVASHLHRLKYPSLYRIHEVPSSDKLFQFKEVLYHLGFEIKFPKKISPQDLAQVLKIVKGHPEEKLVQYLLLRTMQQAIYDTKNQGHFGLASQCYTHFTSPIRRYPDLVVHRCLREQLKLKDFTNKAKKQQKKQLRAIAQHSSRRERIAMEAEWEALDLMTTLFMKQFLGESFSGAVARVAKFGFFVELEAYYVQGLVLLEDIKEDYFVFDEKHHRLRGRRSKKVFKIGTPVKVQVSKVDLEERRVYFVLDSGRKSKPTK